MEDWTSILRLATKWNFLSLRELAVERLLAITSPIDKVVLGHTFDLPKWLPLAYAQLCERAKPLTTEEGKRLGELGPVGVDIVIRLWQVFHELKSVSVSDRNYTETVNKIFELDDGGTSKAPPQIANAPAPLHAPAVPVFSFAPSTPTLWPWHSATSTNAIPSVQSGSEKTDVGGSHPPAGLSLTGAFAATASSNSVASDNKAVRKQKAKLPRSTVTSQSPVQDIA